MFNILLIGESNEHLTHIGNMLKAVGHHVAHFKSKPLLELEPLVKTLKPDLVLIDFCDALRDSLEQYCISSPHSDSPLLVLGQNLDPTLSTHLRDAGLAVYASGAKNSNGDINTNQADLMLLMPILNMMLQREQKLKNEVASLKTELAERKDIERAKDYLARYMNTSPDHAFKTMREQAMQQRRSIADLARTILKHQIEVSQVKRG